MRRLLPAVGALLLCGPPAHAAFEALRAVSTPAAFDPLRPALHYWHLAPARLADGAPRIHVAAAQPYGLSALSLGALDFTANPGSLGLGVSLSTLGTSTYYSELLIASGVAVKPVDAVAVGLLLEYGRVQAGSRFAPLHQLALGAGIRARLGPLISIDLGACGMGPGPESGIKLFTPRLSGGLTLHYSTDLCVRLSAQPHSQWTLGETVLIGQRMALAADLITSPLRLALGLLLKAGPFGFDFLYRDHPELGGDVTFGVVFYT